MASAAKNMVFGSMAAAGLVALLCIVDLAAGFPFSNHMVFDITFLIGSVLVLYLAWDAYSDLGR